MTVAHRCTLRWEPARFGWDADTRAGTIKVRPLSSRGERRAYGWIAIFPDRTTHGCMTDGEAKAAAEAWFQRNRSSMV